MMPWNTLQKSLLNSTGKINSRRKRRSQTFRQNENLDIIDSGDSDSCIQKTPLKKSKLDITITNFTQNTSRSEGEIFYDEQTANYCNGCSTKPTSRRIPLSLYTDNKQTRSSEKRNSKEKKIKNVPNINIIQNTFREFENDVQYLERSIMEQSSDEEPVPEIEAEEEESDSITGKGRPISEENLNISQGSSDVQHRTAADREHNKDLNFLVNEIKKDLRPKKKLRCKKGGYLERLQKVLNSSESDYAFWQHEKKCGLISNGTIAKVKSISESYGRKILSLDVNNKEIYFCFEPGKKITNLLHVGDVIDIDFNESNSYFIQNKQFLLSIFKIIKK